MDYIIFAVGVLVMLMVCGGLFYGATVEMTPPSYRKKDKKEPVESVEKSLTRSETENI